ncbi:hypothetical protein AVEN_164745-1 [Araneus ventricosus]|uniref:Uncharacterized protein n=1 Tax=Araneus ventricosus TaxID=182803 RepID=A0A4Y2G1T9_ARAVE|nr:hypothetical protein AVEN_164745-1 [Araneus ventricosus]
MQADDKSCGTLEVTVWTLSAQEILQTVFSPFDVIIFGVLLGTVETSLIHIEFSMSRKLLLQTTALQIIIPMFYSNNNNYKIKCKVFLEWLLKITERIRERISGLCVLLAADVLLL